MSRLVQIIDEALRFWRERVRGPVLRTYDQAREELGGVSWRAFGSTERWFADGAPPPLPADAGAGPPPIPLDTGDISLAPPSVAERVRAGLERLGRRGRWIAAASTVGVLAMVLLLIAAPSSSDAAAAALPPPVVQALAPLGQPSPALIKPPAAIAAPTAAQSEATNAAVARHLALLSAKAQRAHRKTHR